MVLELEALCGHRAPSHQRTVLVHRNGSSTITKLWTSQSHPTAPSIVIAAQIVYHQKMVLFFASTGELSRIASRTVVAQHQAAANPPVTLYMGKDKPWSTDEDLIKYAWPQDVWFHVDKLSSAHVYLRMPESMSWESIPEPLLADCAQLVKANSIEGNKKDNLTIIYTPADNLKKTGDMAVGQVSFHSDKRVRRVHVAKRENPVVNRLNKTKVERQVDHEQERIDRIKQENAVRRAAAAQKKKADAELARTREAEKAARSYDTLFSQQEDDDDNEAGQAYNSVREMEDDFM
ncbi:uncharacterized protein FIBRA_05883 [Fibroporia radiculosa]|uniref:NFACT RNA-binding domain-containing protein n=1 Tax=Fibroporia radiculosa TaxID=599839 RepID=J4HY94_9APHY|nr:uncharacterized protein FIBRA_05883 [Fibroporia radiculosa]CCM03737.1 predicted protein [Fibroporia radiculosa]